MKDLQAGETVKGVGFTVQHTSEGAACLLRSRFQDSGIRAGSLGFRTCGSGMPLPRPRGGVEAGEPVASRGGGGCFGV